MCNCPQCDSNAVTLLGTLGTLDHFRCRLCGWVWSETHDDSDDSDTTGDAE